MTMRTIARLLSILLMIAVSCPRAGADDPDGPMDVALGPPQAGPGAVGGALELLGKLADSTLIEDVEPAPVPETPLMRALADGYLSLEEIITAYAGKLPSEPGALRARLAGVGIIFMFTVAGAMAGQCAGTVAGNLLRDMSLMGPPVAVLRQRAQTIREFTILGGVLGVILGNWMVMRRLLRSRATRHNAQ